MRRQHQGHQRKPWSKKKEQKNLIKEKKSKNVDFSVFLYWDNDDDIDDDDVGDDTCTGCILRIFSSTTVSQIWFWPLSKFPRFSSEKMSHTFLICTSNFFGAIFLVKPSCFHDFFSVFSREPFCFHDFFSVLNFRSFFLTVVFSRFF